MAHVTASPPRRVRHVDEELRVRIDPAHARDRALDADGAAVGGAVVDEVQRIGVVRGGGAGEHAERAPRCDDG